MSQACSQHTYYIAFPPPPLVGTLWGFQRGWHHYTTRRRDCTMPISVYICLSNASLAWIPTVYPQQPPRGTTSLLVPTRFPQKITSDNDRLSRVIRRSVLASRGQNRPRGRNTERRDPRHRCAAIAPHCPAIATKCPVIAPHCPASAPPSFAASRPRRERSAAPRRHGLSRPGTLTRAERLPRPLRRARHPWRALI